MKSNNILNLIKSSGIIIPSILLKYYKELKLNEKELIFLSFLMQKGEKIVFDIELFNKELNFDIPQIMENVSSLSEKKLLNMSVEKNKQGMMMEYLDINMLYNKLLNFLLEEKEEKAESNIYEIIEKEFGRTISPIEYETIKGWLDSNIEEELIQEALKEAILNGVNNLKYIDKILYEWNKKGYKKPNDIKRKKDQKEEKVDLFDYDWLEDNE